MISYYEKIWAESDYWRQGKADEQEAREHEKNRKRMLDGPTFDPTDYGHDGYEGQLKVEQAVAKGHKRRRQTTTTTTTTTTTMTAASGSQIRQEQSNGSGKGSTGTDS